MRAILEENAENHLGLVRIHTVEVTSSSLVSPTFGLFAHAVPECERTGSRLVCSRFLSATSTTVDRFLLCFAIGVTPALERTDYI